MNEIKEQPKQELSSDINIITAEINAYKQVAGEAIFEIGRRLKHVKENDLVHGEWSKWCKEEIEIDRAQADKFIKVADELGNECTYTQKGLRALYEIATLPQEERNKEHTLSNGKTKTVDEMTVIELREVKRKLKQTERQLEQARNSAEIAARKYEQLAERELEIKTEYIQPDDYEDLRRENETYRRLYGDSTIYEENTRRVGNDDAITYNVFEFSEDVRKFIEKYGHLTHFPKEFNEMIPEGKEEFQSSITQLLQFLGALDRSMQEGTVIINQ